MTISLGACARVGSGPFLGVYLVDGSLCSYHTPRGLTVGSSILVSVWDCVEFSLTKLNAKL